MEFRAEVVAVILRRLRKKRRLSQEVLSGLAGIARPHLSMIERGERMPNLYTIWRLADAFDMRPSELISLIEEEMKKMGPAGQEDKK